MSDPAPPEPTSAASPVGAVPEDVGYREGAIDLLGVLAYGELTAFERLAEDAAMAPTLADKVKIGSLAATQFQHFSQVRDRLAEFDVDVVVAMEPFFAPFNSFHEHTKPKSWLEGLVKAYVGDGIARDFYREIAVHLAPEDRDLVQHVLGDAGQDDLVVASVTEAIGADERLAGRLALWGRRLVGEAIAQTQYVAVERDSLASLVVGGGGLDGGLDLAELGRMFTRLTEAHAARMQRLGLAS